VQICAAATAGPVAGGLTTQDLVAAERRLIAAAIGRAGEETAVVDDAVVDRAPRASIARSAPSRPRRSARSRARVTGVDVIEALTGTGKANAALNTAQVNPRQMRRARASPRRVHAD
jgi:hypothetical protein